MRVRWLFLIACSLGTSCAPEGTESVLVAVGEEGFSVGALDGDPSMTIGSIDDLAVGAAGEVIVVDGINSLVRRYNSSGSFDKAVGREGDGPGEFRRPSEVVVGPRGDLLILDPGKWRLSRLSGDSLQFMETMDFPFLPRDICLLGDRMFVLGLHAGLVLHEFSLEGELIGSFGDPIPYPVANAVVQDDSQFQSRLDDYSASGDLVCHEATETLTVLPRTLPNLRNWSAQGTLRWEVVLEDYSQTEVNRTENGWTMGVNSETGLATGLVSLVELSDDYLLTQTADGSYSIRPGEATVQSRVVSLATGEVRQVVGDLPRLRKYVDGIGYGWEEVPFPRLFAIRVDVAY